MRSYPSKRIWEEVAYIAFYLHWPYEQIMQMQHSERRGWLDEIAKVNHRLNDGSEAKEQRWQ